MEDAVARLMNQIVAQEMPKINNIMKEMSEQIRKDLYSCTLILLDTYYDGYKRPPRKYIRIDEAKSMQPRTKNGKFAKRHGNNGRKNALGKSLRQVMWDGEDAISFISGNHDGYSSGLMFREEYFNNTNEMFHPNAGISEFQMVENFLFSNTNGVGQHPKMMRLPEADKWLDAHLDHYDNYVDELYQNACKKFR